MANWKDSTSFGDILYKDTTNDEGVGPSGPGTFMNNNVYVSLQYDADSETTTKCDVRFKLRSKSGTAVSYQDSMYILYDAESSSRTLITLKGWTTGNWTVHYSDRFTITKTIYDCQYSFPTFYICNNGQNRRTTTASNFYTYFSGNDQGYRHKITNGSKVMHGKHLAGGSITITDNYNNTFSIAVTQATSSGVPGHCLAETTVMYGSTSACLNTGSLNTSSYSIGDLTTSDTKTVYAKVTFKAECGGTHTLSKNANIEQYQGPELATNLILRSTRDDGKFIVKNPWKLLWMKPDINNNCPIKGYRIRLYRKRGEGEFITLPIYSQDGHVISSTDGTDHCYTRESTETEMIVYTQYYTKEDVRPGDEISFSVTAYTRYGKDHDGDLCMKDGTSYYCNSSGCTSDKNERTTLTVQNAGIVHVKVGDDWREGQVYVKVGDNDWREAESVHVNVNGTWRESV